MMSFLPIAPLRAKFSPALAARGANATLLIAATFGFALIPIFSRPLMAAGLAPEAAALIRFLPGVALLLPTIRTLLADTSRRRAAGLFVLTGVANGLALAGYMRGLEKAPVAVAGTIYMSYPLLVILLAWLLYKRRPTARAAVAGVLVILGAATLISGSGGLSADTLSALAFCLPTPILFALSVLVLVNQRGALSTTDKIGASNLGATLALLPLLAQTESPLSVISVSASVPWLVLGLGLITALGPQLLYYYAAPRLPEAQVATLGSLELPLMVGFGWLFFGESLGSAQIIAVLLIAAAISMVPGRVKTPKSPEARHGLLLATRLYLAASLPPVRDRLLRRPRQAPGAEA